MKNFNKLCVLAVFALLGTMAFAKMNGPTGLAVDAKGNLYVANFTSNQIQVYGPTHTLAKSKTITTNIAGPLAVALDPAGYVWVALSGHPKTGQRWSGQNRPTGRGRGHSCFTLQLPVQASPFSYANSEDHI